MKIKKTIFLSIGIIIALLIGVILFFFFPRYYFDRDIRLCMSIKDMQTSCVASIAIERDDPNICITAFGGWLSTKKEDCMSYFVEKKGDSESCKFLSSKDISGKEINDSYINDCLIKSLTNNPDPKVCDGIDETFDRYQCYYTLAKEHGLVGYCDKLIGKLKNPDNNLIEVDWTDLQYRCRKGL